MWKWKSAKERFANAGQGWFYTEGLWAARLDLASGPQGCRQWCRLEQPSLTQVWTHRWGCWIFLFAFSGKYFASPFFLNLSCVWWQEILRSMSRLQRTPPICVLGPCSSVALGSHYPPNRYYRVIPGWQGESGWHQHSPAARLWKGTDTSQESFVLR